MPFTSIISAAERELSRRSHGRVGLQLADIIVDYPGAACTILRASVTQASGMPTTVVLKHWNTGPEPMRQEWAALTFCEEVPDTRALVPKLFGADADAGLLIIEDLGASDDQLVGSILFARGPERATTALGAFSAALGRLNAPTTGRAPQFHQVRRRCAAGATSRHRVHRLPAHLAAFTGVAVSDQARKELAHMVEMLVQPSPFHALTHDDSTPGNAFYRDGRIRLLDLESAEFRNALVDGSMCRLRYLHSVWVRKFPVAVQHRMQDAYRTELVRGCPEASDDELFGAHLLAASAAWMAALCEELAAVIEQDRTWERASTRQRIVASLEQFERLANEWHTAPALAKNVSDLAARLRTLWPPADCNILAYDAFVESEAPPH